MPRRTAANPIKLGQDRFSRAKKSVSNKNKETKTVKKGGLTQVQQTKLVKSLGPIAREVNTRLEKATKFQGQADDHRLAAALRLAEIKKKLGEAKLDFKPWVEKNIKQSYQTARKLAVVGESDNPQEALAAMRDKNAAANKKLRAEKKLGKGTVRAGKTSKEQVVDVALGALEKMPDAQRVKLITSVAKNEGLEVHAAGAEPKARKAKPGNQVSTIDEVKSAFMTLSFADKAAFAGWAATKIAELADESSEMPPVPKAMRRTRKTKRAA